VNLFGVQFALTATVCFSHHTRTTTWEDPRKTLAAQQAQQHQASQEQLLSHGATSPHPAASPQPQGTRFSHLSAVSGVAPDAPPPIAISLDFRLLQLAERLELHAKQLIGLS